MGEGQAKAPALDDMRPPSNSAMIFRFPILENSTGWAGQFVVLVCGCMMAYKCIPMIHLGTKKFLQ